MVDIFGQSLSLLLVVAGVGLCIAEALAPGAHFIVLGVALLAAGLLGLLFAPLASPLALAAIVLVVGALTLYVYRQFDLYGGRGAGRTEGSAGLKGRRGYVVERVTTRAGKVELERGGFDSTYAARTIDGEIEAGSEVIVVDPGGGNVLTVESVDSDVDEIDRELARERDRTEGAPDGRGTPSGETQTERRSERETDRERERE